ncbi:MAG: hypothetical protein KJ856_09190 [Gammaproteobacteria bacterium]|nr:hypothetical protein [Gammaproteobacteria bacterium]MBU1479122.1 hypothetical protein [Gammaproteobacteria bacterium]MBU2003074.1 hypothetical protein [Gammaproteobacteria bacterium]MBU2134270.1 hypothetical protein [Gammaproteobacteria bacterium]MBU2187182.1 hypothetical protein [Gammaproteobacteria bacterium]
MNICFVGSSNTIFTHSYLKLFSLIGEDVSFIDIGKEENHLVEILPDSSVLKLYTGKLRPNRKSLMKRFLKHFKLDTHDFFLFLSNFLDLFKKVNAKKISEIEVFLNAKKPDLIVYFWGTTVRAEKNAITKIVTKCFETPPKSLLIVNTYPVRSGVEYNSKYFFAFFDSFFFKSFDALSFPSENMKCFFDKNKLKYKRFNILPDFLSSQMLNSECESLDFDFSFNKKIIFLGNTDFKSRTIDDVYNELESISKFGIEVWMQESNDLRQILNDYPNDNIKTFNSFTYKEMLGGNLTAFLKNFDAVIMTYNGINNARTATGFPTRFALALSASIPIFIKSDTFLFLESKFEGVVVTYQDAFDFSSKLSSVSYQGTLFPLFIEEYAEQWNSFLNTL